MSEADQFGACHMPIRFRCAYCNQLLGIAKRKAGMIVRCTNCDGQIIVPEAEPEVAQTAGVGSRDSGIQSTGGRRTTGPSLFERNDIDDLLKPFQVNDGASQGDEPTAHAALRETDPVSEPAPAAKAVVPTPPPAPGGHLMLIITVAAVVLAFVAGFFIGRATAG